MLNWIELMPSPEFSMNAVNTREPFPWVKEPLIGVKGKAAEDQRIEVGPEALRQALGPADFLARWSECIAKRVDVLGSSSPAAHVVIRELSGEQLIGDGSDGELIRAKIDGNVSLVLFG